MKILVVEDEHRIANSIKKGLEQERYAVDVAYDGQEGLDLATSGDYDLIVLDLMLPGISGMEICKHLRNDGVQTSIVMLTARGQLQDKVEGLDTGADDYMTKPFAFEELLARIRALTRRPRKISGETIRVAGLELDTKKYQAMKDGANIILTAREYALLEYMMRHLKQVLSKTQIIEHVWNYDAEVLPNTVEVYVRNLRNKIGREFVQTVRGFGYRMGGE